jgi:hypothetical protein
VGQDLARLVVSGLLERRELWAESLRQDGVPRACHPGHRVRRRDWLKGGIFGTFGTLSRARAREANSASIQCYRLTHPKTAYTLRAKVSR